MGSSIAPRRATVNSAHYLALTSSRYKSLQRQIDFTVTAVTYAFWGFISFVLVNRNCKPARVSRSASIKSLRQPGLLTHIPHLHSPDQEKRRLTPPTPAATISDTIALFSHRYCIRHYVFLPVDPRHPCSTSGPCFHSVVLEVVVSTASAVSATYHKPEGHAAGAQKHCLRVRRHRYFEASDASGLRQETCRRLREAL